MIVAIMQPYFFPYIGYWQLLRAADKFVLLDDVQYMRHSWINRNRILKPTGGWQYIVVPLEKHEMTAPIKEVKANAHVAWREQIIRQLAHYRRKTPYFEDTMEIVKEAMFATPDHAISAIDREILKVLARHLGLTTELVVSSQRKFDYSKVRNSGDWALRISEQLGAAEYINPVSGRGLFDPDMFAAGDIKLSFLKPKDIVYPQADIFEPNLSIIDVLMFNGVERTKQLLDAYSIESVSN